MGRLRLMLVSQALKENSRPSKLCKLLGPATESTKALNLFTTKTRLRDHECKFLGT
jgi:hypothetical protein